ncbi:NAD+ synthetase [Desulfamplus magnetovallimortis]|uniref:NH(3)-dependent NAD(+) synthetase n=1 Tax=Desulfamplus magnetovallimortis TaxID=1246637 RepID=A0A1W1H6X4_9BACT|nr:NAD(+) synthase [Desulfamplus magnetovallimortis]SLM28128.1 NAD+ synthetase [Desulfamplus magnetovallimortis]
MKEIALYIEKWLSDYCREAGLKGFVVGVSGGIDSAVTSTLCARTGLDVILLNMPIYQAPEQISLASAHIDRLVESFGNVRGETIDLTPVFQQMEKSLPSKIQDALTMANTRSRLRMVTLYAQATHHRMLVAGTGNRVEDFGVGFYTKYGDGGVDISPIADLMKTEVFAMGRYLGIHEDILNAPPTDGLWEDGRTDESQIGATYPELEWAMCFEEAPKDMSLLSIPQQKVLAIYRKFNRMNRHKMEPIPVCKIPDDLRLNE